jgi:hypothetical protein
MGHRGGSVLRINQSELWKADDLANEDVPTVLIRGSQTESEICLEYDDIQKR